MRRFDQRLLFDSLATNGLLHPPLMQRLVDHIVDFHGQAEPRLDRGGAAAIAEIEHSNIDCLHRAGAAYFEPDQIAALHARSLEILQNVAGLLDTRRAAGRVRRCHGDLHLRNICVFQDKPMLFDCLEFSDELAAIDILYDFAFLLMDLEHRGLSDLANAAANRYLDLTDDDEGLAALPLFLSVRAAIRAHVTAAAVNHTACPVILRIRLPRPARILTMRGLSLIHSH